MFGVLLAAAAALAAPAPGDDRTVPVGPTTGPSEARPADEVDELVAKLKPPARFRDYRPRFRLVERAFTFHHVKGPVEETWRVVLDGDKYVALVRPGDFNLLALTPEMATTTLKMPTGRYHLDTTLGPVLTTHQFIQKRKDYELEGKPNADQTDTWSAGGATLTLVRRSASEEREVRNTFEIRVDPVLGYTITGTYESWWKSIPAKRPSFGGWAFCPGNYTLWPDTQIYERTVFSPDSADSAESGGLWGWANNLIAMDRVDGDRKHFAWRDGGLIAYLDKDTGFSPCRTRAGGGGPVTMSLCNAHNDFHINIDVLKDAPRGPDGRHVVRQVHRLVALPPELTNYIWDHMTLYGKGQSAVMIRIGELEDFEKQPVPVTEPVRGLVWTSGGPRITTDQARSGKQSLFLTGTAWPNLPQCSLLPETKYRLEAWCKLATYTDEERAAFEKKHGRPPDAVVRAFIKGDFYEWSPHSREWILEQQTNVVTSEKEGWQQVFLEFTTPKWDPFINIVFVVENGKAYLDDFRLVRLGAAAAGGEAASR